MSIVYEIHKHKTHNLYSESPTLGSDNSVYMLGAGTGTPRGTTRIGTSIGQITNAVFTRWEWSPQTGPSFQPTNPSVPGGWVEFTSNNHKLVKGDFILISTSSTDPLCFF
jgi:hypothetical protein